MSKIGFAISKTFFLSYKFPIATSMTTDTLYNYLHYANFDRKNSVVDFHEIVFEY